MLDISSKYTDIEVIGKFKDKLNVLWGESGSGKTFLFSKIKSYLQDAGVTYVEIPHNASSSTVLGILSTLQEGAVVVYDSGDLSFDTEICKCIDRLDIICVISLKTLKNAKYTDYGLYTVKYSPGTLLVEEL